MGSASSIWCDARTAVPLALGMSAAWSLLRWDDLTTGRLPDTDDLMRLQQIRDWLGGQAFGAVTQARLGVEGTAMHWSRLPDLMPGATIALLRPVVGVANAELAALILWPAILFAAFALLTARLARTLGASPLDAVLVALLAYPVTALFAPGRIDHHGLQLVLLLGTAAALIGRPTSANGAIAGALAIAGLTVGMETAPLLGVAIGAALVRWTYDLGEGYRIKGLAIGLGVGAVTALAFATDGWRFPGCDGFTMASWRAAVVGAVAIGMLAVAASRLGLRGRIAALALVGAGLLTTVALAAPQCLSPYGTVDPLLARSWLAEVAEAQPLLTANPRWALAYAGLLGTAIVAGIIIEWRLPRPERRLLLAVATAALALACVQIRGVYGGVAVAVPLLAEAITNARRRGVATALAARLLAAGIIYPSAAAAFPAAAPRDQARCDMTSAQAALRSLPPARVLAPIDMGPWLITATHHHAIAGPYHRNAEGNLAVGRFTDAGAATRRQIATDLRVDYWVGCRGEGLTATGTDGLWRAR